MDFITADDLDRMLAACGHEPLWTVSINVKPQDKSARQLEVRAGLVTGGPRPTDSTYYGKVLSDIETESDLKKRAAEDVAKMEGGRDLALMITCQARSGYTIYTDVWRERQRELGWADGPPPQTRGQLVYMREVLRLLAVGDTDDVLSRILDDDS